MNKRFEQKNLFEPDTARSLLDQLLTDSRIYKTTKDYQDLLDFVVRLRNFAPFNAMLLQMQKPGLSYAASAQDWFERFGRTIKEGARPLLILWPFGPVAFVYDVMDTEGNPLPVDVAAFFASGPVNEEKLVSFMPLLWRRNIECRWVDEGDRNAGRIRVIQRPSNNKEPTYYRILINRNHPSPVKFATLVHELGHLFLSHLGPDKNLNVPERMRMDYTQGEIEAESVAFLVCARNGVKSKSEVYLMNFVNNSTTVDMIDIYQVMRAAGQIEASLGLTAKTKFNSSKSL